MNRKLRLFSCLLALGAPLGGCYVDAGAGASVQPAAPPPPSGQAEVIVEAPPPPPPAPPPEPPPPPPSPEHVWVNSYYRWNGRSYDMERGHYERRPRANARWQNAHWEHRGRGQVWVDGRFD